MELYTLLRNPAVLVRPLSPTAAVEVVQSSPRAWTNRSRAITLEGTMNLEIASVILTGIGVLLGVWRILAHYENRQDKAHADLGRRIDALGTDVTNLRERMASLGGEIRGFMAGFQAKDPNQA